MIKSLHAICDAHDAEFVTTPVFEDPWVHDFRASTSSRDQLAVTKLRLVPLLGLESTLAARIGEGFTVAGRTEVCVRRGWQDTVVWRPAKRKPKASSRSGSADGRLDDPHSDIQVALADSLPLIQQLWHHPSVKHLIQRRRLRLEDAGSLSVLLYSRAMSDLIPCSFLDEITRIAQTGYLPTDDDILRARIRTIGISEWCFQFTCPGARDICNWRVSDLAITLGLPGSLGTKFPSSPQWPLSTPHF